MRIPEVRYVAFRSKRNFGIELEFNQKIPAKDLVKIVAAADPDHAVLQSGNYQQDYDNDFWHVKFDRSCGDVRDQGGWEVASYKGHGFKDVEIVGDVTEALAKGGVKVNDECGFHIHVEIADFNHSQASVMAARWFKIENIVLEMLPKHRRNNKYAKPMSKRIDVDPYKVYTAETFWPIVRPQRYDHPNRRVAFNLCNYAQWIPGRKTVELRLPEGTTSSDDVKNWIRFFVSFVELSKKSPFPASLSPVDLLGTLNMLELHGTTPFRLLSKGLRDTKLWVAKRILKYSSKKDALTTAQDVVDLLEMPKSDAPEIIHPPAGATKSHESMSRYKGLWWSSRKKENEAIAAEFSAGTGD